MVNDGDNILRAGDARHKKTACAVFGVELTAIERLNQRILYVEKKGIGADINKQTGTGAGYFLQFDGKALRIVGNDSNLLIVFYVQIMPDDLVMQLHRF